jgi:hypothetical protein
MVKIFYFSYIYFGNISFSIIKIKNCETMNDTDKPLPLYKTSQGEASVKSDEALKL